VSLSPTFAILFDLAAVSTEVVDGLDVHATGHDSDPGPVLTYIFAPWYLRLWRSSHESLDRPLHRHGLHDYQACGEQNAQTQTQTRTKVTSQKKLWQQLRSDLVVRFTIQDGGGAHQGQSGGC
jgi:hypothetical protein